jgi:hypothetical protein
MTSPEVVIGDRSSRSASDRPLLDEVLLLPCQLAGSMLIDVNKPEWRRHSPNACRKLSTRCRQRMTIFVPSKATQARVQRGPRTSATFLRSSDRYHMVD